MPTRCNLRQSSLFLDLRCKLSTSLYTYPGLADLFISIMRPNTPHLVYTPASAICSGGHFYCMSTIRDSIYGIFHTFSASSLLTNTEHTKDAHLLLQRIITYIHCLFIQHDFDTSQPDMPAPDVPDVSTFDGLIDLLMLCVVMELSNLLNPRAYQRDLTPKHHELLVTLHTCGLA